MTLTTTESLIAAGIGVTAGVLGGLSGIGGSLVMLPALAILLHDPEPDSAQHLYMAAAMCVNVLVAVPATIRHHRARVVRVDLVRYLLPAMLLAIVAGVLLSNQVRGTHLRHVLAAFIAAYCVKNLALLALGRREAFAGRERAGPARLVPIGAFNGVVAGLLGIGGGVLMVPMLQVFCRVPVRQAIATSSAVMVFTAAVGATVKVSTLDRHERLVVDALGLAVAMGPAAVVGSFIGASLVHALPVRVVRGAVSVALLAASAKMAGLI
jgi:uncharacterized membrane protein YfcA